MRPAVVLALAALVLLPACGRKPFDTGGTLSVMKEPSDVCAPLQPTRNLWATIRQTARARIMYAQAKCQRQELSVAECAQINKDVETVSQLSFEITRALDNPRAELDVGKITKILEVTAKIVGALTP